MCRGRYLLRSVFFLFPFFGLNWQQHILPWSFILLSLLKRLRMFKTASRGVTCADSLLPFISFVILVFHESSGSACDLLPVNERPEPLRLKAVEDSTNLALQHAGMVREDMDFFELHDAYSIMVRNINQVACEFGF